MHRSTDLEGQFLGLLRRLSAPESFLEARFEASAKSQRRHLLARLSTLKKELSTVAVRRAKVFNAFEAGDLAQKFLQQRLEELRAEEDSLGAAARAVEDELAVDRAKRASLDSAKSIVQEAADTWLMANIPDRQAIAKKVAEIVGGLFVRFEDHTLYPGIDENKRCVEKRESSTVTPLVSEVFKGA